MEKLRFLAILGVVVLALSILAGCDEDEENNPITPGATTGSVAGTVTFKGDWPASGEVQVSIYASLNPPYIPMGAPDAYTDPIAPGTNQYDYVLDGLDKGDYMAIFVSWREPANPAGTKLIGMYWTDPDSSGIDPNTGLPVQIPSGVTIEDGNMDHTGLDITADLDLVP